MDKIDLLVSSIAFLELSALSTEVIGREQVL